MINMHVNLASILFSSYFISHTPYEFYSQFEDPNGLVSD